MFLSKVLPLHYLLCVIFIGTAMASGMQRAQAASDGLVTIVEGRARLMRGASFFTLKEGMALNASDIIETETKTHVQIEFSDGSSSGLGPTTSAYLVALPDGVARPGELFLHSGWLKISNPAALGLLRGSTAGIHLHPKGGTFVLHRQDRLDAFFVESGELTPVGAVKSFPRTGVRKAGEFVEVLTDNTINVLGRPSALFLAALPRPFVDTLPSQFSKFSGRKVEPQLERPVSFEDVDAWVKAYPAERKSLLRRFSVRVRDPVFRQRVEGHLSSYPEWDPLLHPEKYPPKTNTP